MSKAGKKPLLRRAIDGTLHAHPAGTPATKIEQYEWKYENGQDLPKSAFSANYRRARAMAGSAVYQPRGNEGRNEQSGKRVRVTVARAKTNCAAENDDIRWGQVGEGLLKLAGGGLAVAGGVGLCGTGLGCVAGAPMGAIGASDFVQGADMLFDGVRGEKSEGYNPLRNVARSVSPKWGDTAYNAASLAATAASPIAKVRVVVDPTVTGIKTTKPIFADRVPLLDGSKKILGQVFDSNLTRALLGASVGNKVYKIYDEYPREKNERRK